MKLRIGLDEIMNRLVRNDRKKDHEGMIKVESALMNPDNSKFHIKSSRPEEVKKYLRWERENVGLIID